MYLDLGHVCDSHTDAGLEAIYKAMGEEPPDNGIWEPHPNPYLQRIVELFTQRGLDRIEGVRAELERWLKGDMHDPKAQRPPRPTGAVERWSGAELSLVKLYLEALPPAEFSLDDWMLVVDYLAQRYLPAEALRSEAEWLASRSAMMGRIEAALLRPVTDTQADAILAALPTAPAGSVTPEARALVDYGRARCCEHVTALSDVARHRMRSLIVDYQEGVALGIPQREALETRLLDTFGTLNRDWRRIAVTEATENANQGYVAAQGPGANLRRVEKYIGACPFCRSIDGRVFEVVDPSKPDKDGETQVWVGKTNVGRSASPRRRLGNLLVERQPHERWWPAAGAQHPNCRGGWTRAAAEASPDPEFEAWLETLGGKE